MHKIDINNFLNKRYSLRNLSDSEFELIVPELAYQLENIDYIPKYDEKKLDLDLENLKNLRFRFAEIVDVESEEKSWGSVLVLKLRNEDKVVKYHLSIVRDWVSYPIKSPMTFLKINWLPVVQYVRSEMKR